MATSAQYTTTPGYSADTVTTADSSYTAPTNYKTILTGPSTAAGSGVGYRINKVICCVKGNSSQCVVRFFCSTDNLTTQNLINEIIIPANSIELLSGSILDYNDSQGLIIRNPNKPLAPSVDGLVSDDAMSVSINEVLRGEVNPALASHGGFVTYVGHDGEGTAYLTMGGGCHGCSMSRMTMLEGVQTTLVEKVPGVLKVRDLTDHNSGENPYYS